MVFGESGNDSGFGDNAEQADGAVDLGLFSQTVEKLEGEMEEPRVEHVFFN